VLPSLLATLWIALGEKDRAFPLLQKGCAERHPGLLTVAVDPLFDGIRSDPSFKKLLKCLHLDSGALARR
jgi:hypothetical protein